MLLPDKYIPVEDTLPSISSHIYRKLRFPLPLFSLWDKVRGIKAIGTYERFIYALDFLYTLGLIDIEGGFIRRLKNVEGTVREQS